MEGEAGRDQGPQLDLDCKNPHVGEQVSHDPVELLAAYAQKQEGIAQLREQLKAALAEALERDA